MRVIGKVKKFLKRNRGTSNFYHDNAYTPRLMELAATEFSNPDHREKRVRMDKIANALVVKVANLITERSPIFLDENDNEMEDLKKQWEENLYNDLLNDVIQTTRTHGYAVVEPKQEPIGEGRLWFVHDSTTILRIALKSNYNIDFYDVLPKYDQAEKVSMTGAPTQYTLYPADVIHHYIGKFVIGETGLATLEPVWSGLVRYSEIEESMAMYDSRIGRGVLVVSVDENIYTGEIPALKNAIKGMNNRGYLLLKHGEDGTPPKIDYSGSTHMVDFPKDMYMILQGIAASTGFSIKFLSDTAKGTISTAKEDKIKNWENLKSIFEEYKKFIRKLLLMQEDGEALNDRVKKIEFDHGGNLPDEDEEVEGETKERVRLTKEIKD